MKKLLFSLILSTSAIVFSSPATAPGIYDLIEANNIDGVRLYLAEGKPLNAVRQQIGSHSYIRPMVNHQGLSPLQYARAKDSHAIAAMLATAGAVGIWPFPPRIIDKATSLQKGKNPIPLHNYVSHKGILVGTWMWKNGLPLRNDQGTSWLNNLQSLFF